MFKSMRSKIVFHKKGVASLLIVGAVAVIALFLIVNSQQQVIPTGAVAGGCEATCQSDCDSVKGKDKQFCLQSCMGGRCGNRGILNSAVVNGILGIDCEADGRCNSFCATDPDPDCAPPEPCFDPDDFFNTGQAFFDACAAATGGCPVCFQSGDCANGCASGAVPQECGFCKTALLASCTGNLCT